MQVKTAVYVQRAAQELKTQKWRINEEQKKTKITLTLAKTANFYAAWCYMSCTRETTNQ